MHRRIWMIVAALLPLGARAAPTSEVRSLQQQVVALQLDHALNLTPQQAQALLPVLQDAKAQLQAFQEQRAAARPALVAALNQAVSDLRTAGAISDGTAQAIAAARGAPANLRQNLRSTWQQARQILTADQLEALGTVRLGIHPASTAAAGGRGGRPHMARRGGVMRTLLSDPFVALVRARAG